MTKKKADGIWILLALAVIGAIALVGILGCESAQERPQWGKGDLPPKWQEYFGTDNGSRMDYVQATSIDAISQRLAQMEPDPNAISLEKRLDILELKVDKLSFVGPWQPE